MNKKRTTRSEKEHPDRNDMYTPLSVADTDSKETGPSTDTPSPHLQDDPTFWQRTFSWRFVMVILFHVAYSITSAPITTFTMAIVCMSGPVTSPVNETLYSNSSASFNVSQFILNGTHKQEKKYEFAWDNETRGFLLSTVSFLRALSPQLAHLLRGYLGNKVTLSLTLTTLAVVNFLTPMAARTSHYFLVAILILSGLLFNTPIPIVGDMLAWWVPVKEKLTSVTIVSMGWITSGMIFPLLAGYICLIPVDNGWPLIFYFNGLLLVLYSIAWYFLTSQKPEDHPYISPKEKTYIAANRVAIGGSTTKEVEKTPYRSILTSCPVHAYILSSAVCTWCISVIWTCLPLYFTSVLKFSLQEAGVVFSVVFCCRIPAAFLWSAFGNYLHGMKAMTTNRVRKVSFIGGQAFAGIFFVAASFLDDQNKWAASVLIILAVFFLTSAVPIMSVIPLDMAPRHAGFIIGLFSSAISVFGITAPIIVAELTKKGLHAEWQVVLIIMAAAHAASSLIFLVFGDASIQPWAVEKLDIVETISVTDKKTFDQLK